MVMTSRSSATRVAYRIRVQAPASMPHIQAGLQASVDCEAQNRAMSVSDCQRCARFERIGVHEGAYVLWCHPDVKPRRGEL